jgi:hypothetical protein
MLLLYIVGFPVDKLKPEQVFLQVLVFRYSPVDNILPMLHIDLIATLVTTTNGRNLRNV